MIVNFILTVPGVVMPMARLDAIGVSLFGGTILPGSCEGREEKWDAQTVMEASRSCLRSCFIVLYASFLFQAIGSYGAGLIDIEELHKIECFALPGSGSCGMVMIE